MTTVASENEFGPAAISFTSKLSYMNNKQQNVFIILLLTMILRLSRYCQPQTKLSGLEGIHALPSLCQRVLCDWSNNEGFLWHVPELVNWEKKQKNIEMLHSTDPQRCLTVVTTKV